MAVTYTVCGPDVDKLIGFALNDYHNDLKTAGVSIHAVFAHSYDKYGDPVPAVKVHGIPAAAKIQVTSLEDRVRGVADAKLTIDAHYWEVSSEAQRLALLDHELTHLRLATDENGIVFDDLNRPELRLRQHDWELTGFAEVVERHGGASVEARQFSRFQDEFGQLSLFGPVAAKSVADVARDAAGQFNAAMKDLVRDGITGVSIRDSDGTEIYSAGIDAKDSL